MPTDGGIFGGFIFQRGPRIGVRRPKAKRFKGSKAAKKASRRRA